MRKDGRTDIQTDRWADMMKARFAFRKFASAPKNELNLYTAEISICSVSNVYTKRRNELRERNVDIVS
jgi:hypothetical protein